LQHTHTIGDNRDKPRPLRRASVVLVALALTACASIKLPESPMEYLVQAEKAIKDENPERARDLLEAIDPESYRGEDLERYKKDLAQAHFLLGEYYDCYTVLKDFVRLHPASRYSSAVEKLMYASGVNLATTGRSFLLFVDDLADAQKILESFILQFPKSPDVPNALYVLGEAAYLNEDWPLAIERYRDLLDQAPTSQWRERASHRLAMATYNQLTGPDYDAEGLARAERELTAFLESDPKMQDYINEARQALATVVLWRNDKDMRIAKFYLTIGNDFGARYYLQRIIDKPDAHNREEAKQLLAGLGPPLPLPTADLDEQKRP